ncbi:hypothetical protein [Pseudomonas kuykendallii]|uniref:hypothetical protein n=1 Tax=Pseudomonas kuykendallii TaxID=1007099 RepID=UPI0028D5178E|nr:hypothetical protein [Pseudomonas kuykendallii]
MLIAGVPLASVPLASLAGAGDVPPEPGQVEVISAFRWKLRLLVGDQDVSDRLTGAVKVDRQEGAAGIGQFNLCLAAGPVTPTEWKGKPVALDFIFKVAGVTTQTRCYTGRIADPSWNSSTRTLSCTCSDQLQQRVEALSIAEIDALTPAAVWSEDVFEPVDGRSRWDYMNERLSTMAASLDCAADGSMRVTSWFAGTPAFVFGLGTTIYQSIQVDLADLDSQTNVVEIEADYRFSRLWQFNFSFGWTHPDTDGFGGLQGFCAWRDDTSELPTMAMVQEATESAGLTMLSAANYNRLPPNMANPCGDGSPWINNSYSEGLILGASWRGALREVQSVTESYPLRVEVPQSVADAGEVITRQRIAIEIESDRADKWESEPYGVNAGSTGTPGAIGDGDDEAPDDDDIDPVDGINGNLDLRNESRRIAGLKCGLQQARTTLIEAHRGTTVSWQVPTPMALGIDLVHTLDLGDQIRAVGKFRQIIHEFDIASGSALTTISIAVMRGGGNVSDPLTPPPYSTSTAARPVGGGSLPTQLGGRTSSPPYNEDLDGFSGNYSVGNAGEQFPRQFKVPAPQVSDALRDEWKVEIAGTYRLAIPNDLLEL